MRKNENFAITPDIQRVARCNFANELEAEFAKVAAKKKLNRQLRHQMKNGVDGDDDDDLEQIKRSPSQLRRQKTGRKKRRI